MLEEFMKSTAARSYMYQSDEFQLFVRGHEHFEKGIGQSKSPSYQEIASVYSTLFPEFSKPIPAEAETKLDNFMGFFKGLLSRLGEVKVQTKGTVTSYTAFARSYWMMCDTLQEFEGSCIAQYFQSNYQPIFKSPNKETFINPFEVLQNLLKVEEQEVLSMIDALNVKKLYENIRRRLNSKLETDTKDLAKLTAGKKTISSFLSTKPKEAFISNLNGTVEHTKIEIQNVDQILVVMTVRLLELEMPTFLKNRAARYERAIRSFGRVTIREVEDIIGVCRGLAEFQ
jgi:hypothetical protein